MREGGFRPVSQVMGSCFYHVGWQALPGAYAWTPAAEGSFTELETQTEAWNEARRLALGRLAEEAQLAGADAVVGVRLEHGEYDWAARLLEFVAVGTAVESERHDLGDETSISNLSGQEFAALYRHGYLPVGLVATTCVLYVFSGWDQLQLTRSWGSTYRNAEYRDFSYGMYEARRIAMQRIERHAHELGAHGIVGVRFEHEIREREIDRNGVSCLDAVVTVHVIGTAIAEYPLEGEDPPVFVALRVNG